MEMRHIIPISGKDSLATAVWLHAKYPDIDYEYMHNDIGADPPELYEWLNRVEKYLGKPIERVGKDLTQVINEMGFLPSRQVRYCTRIAKVEAMEGYLKGSQATIYYGLRADESERTGYTPNKDTVARYPLREDGLGLSHVYAILEKHNLMPPLFFWKSLFHAVVKELGDYAYLIHSLSKQEFYTLFAWRSRPNCVYCFNQRLYEVVGLIEHHPKLFWNVYAKTERMNGATNYHWKKDYPAERFAMPSEQKRIKELRVKQVVKIIMQRAQLSLFDDLEEIDILAITPCGLLCGK